MAKSQDWDELQYVWTEWRRRSGAPIKDLYQQLVTLNHEAARLNSMFDIINRVLNTTFTILRNNNRLIQRHIQK